MAGVSASAAGEPARGATRVARSGLRPAHVATLLWLRWKLTLRRYTRSARQLVGLVALLLFIVPLAVGLGGASFAAYALLPAAERVQVLFLVLGLLYLAWLVSPLLQYSLNEGLDVTRLQVYPLTRAEQMVALLLGTCFDVSTLVPLALFVVIVLAWHGGWLATVIIIVALLLAYAHMVVLSQLAIAALMGALRSRRYRDLTVVVFALIGVACSLSYQLALRVFAFHAGDPFANLHISGYLQWAPPGMAARAITLARAGEVVGALPWLAALVLLLPLLLALWGRVLDHGITTAEEGGVTRGRRTRGAGQPRAVAPTAGAGRGAAAESLEAPRAARAWPLSGAALAIAGKDVRAYWRDPQLKATFIRSLFYIALVFLPRLYGGGRASTFGGSAGAFDALGPSLLVFWALAPGLLLVLAFALNALGMDQQGLQALFLLPARPLDILWGKNLAVGAAGFAMQVVLTVIMAALTGDWAELPLALVVGLAGILVLLGCGNLASVLAPARMRRLRMGASPSSTEDGCLRTVLSATVLLVMVALLLPMLVALLLPLVLAREAWLAVALPLALLYALGVHQLASRLIAPVLLRREPDILRMVVPEE